MKFRMRFTSVSVSSK